MQQHVDGPQADPHAAPVDPDDPASGHAQPHPSDACDRALLPDGDPRVGALITDVCALIRQCDREKRRCWGA